MSTSQADSIFLCPGKVKPTCKWTSPVFCADLDDQGWPDESDDYTGSDPSVWGGLVGMDIACPDNLAPVAVNDGGVNRADRLPIENSGVTYVQVLSNDYDPDNRDSLTYNDDVLTVLENNITTSYGTVIRAGNVLIYSPTATDLTEDSFTYTISDGDLTSTATVYLRVVEETGHITVQMVGADDQLITAGGSSASLEITGRSQPINDWPLEDGQLELTVALGTSTEETPKLVSVEINPDNVPSGYKIVGGTGAIGKDAEVKEFLTDPTKALLGIDFALNPEPPTPPVNQPPVAAIDIVAPDVPGGRIEYVESDSYDPEGDSFVRFWTVRNVTPDNYGTCVPVFDNSGKRIRVGANAGLEGTRQTCEYKLKVWNSQGVSVSEIYISANCGGSDGYPSKAYCATTSEPGMPTAGPPDDGGSGGGTTEPPTCDSYTDMPPYPDCPDGSLDMVDNSSCTRYCSDDGSGPTGPGPAVSQP